MESIGCCVVIDGIVPAARPGLVNDHRNKAPDLWKCFSARNTPHKIAEKTIAASV